MRRVGGFIVVVFGCMGSFFHRLFVRSLRSALEINIKWQKRFYEELLPFYCFCNGGEFINWRFCARLLFLRNHMIHLTLDAADTSIFSNYKNVPKLRCVYHSNETCWSEIDCCATWHDTTWPRRRTTAFTPLQLLSVIKRVNYRHYLPTLIKKPLLEGIIVGLKSLLPGINLNIFLTTRAIIT